MKKDLNKKNLIFDLDGTLTESRSLITKEMTTVLKEIEKDFNIVIISGAQKSQMLKQIPWLEESSFTIMSQSGNYAEKEGESLWQNNLSFDDLNTIFQHVELYLKEVSNDVIEIRGGQVSVSLTGHNADRDVKKNFDKNGVKRMKILSEFPFEEKELLVRIGGTTCFDYTKVGWGKGGNLERLFGNNKWRFHESVYVGDQLYKGGNDEDVIEIMKTIQVAGPEETLLFIRKLLS